MKSFEIRQYLSRLSIFEEERMRNKEWITYLYHEDLISEEEFHLFLTIYGFLLTGEC